MEDPYINLTSQDEIYTYSNITSSNTSFDNEDYRKIQFIINMMTYPIIVIGLPLTLVAIYALCCQVRKDHVAPIYVINLLISNLIQFCCLIVEVAPNEDLMTKKTFGGIYAYTLMASVGFMVCIALERYLVIAHPLWYRFRRNIKISVVVCVLVWVLPLVYVLTFIFWVGPEAVMIIPGIIFFLPLPLFIFFLGGTLKALSTSRVPTDEKRRIVGVLVLVLLIYTLLFLPCIILLLSKGDLISPTLSGLGYIFLRLSPLADLTLYVFMRKGTIDKFLSSVCCCRMDSVYTNSSSV